MRLDSIRSGRGHRLGTGTGLWVGLVFGLALPADAQVSQFYAFPGEYAASRPPTMPSTGPYTPGGIPYSYSPGYSAPAGGGWPPSQAPGALPPSWASRPPPVYYGAGSLAVPSSSWRLNGNGYNSGLFSPRNLNGTGYDSGLFSRWRLYGTGYDGGLFYGRR